MRLGYEMSRQHGAIQLGQASRLVLALARHARHLQAGRVPHRQVREYNIALPQRAPDPAVVLAAVVEGDDAGQALDQFSPPYENYRKLKAALSQLRGRTAGGMPEPVSVTLTSTWSLSRAVLMVTRPPACVA